MPLGNVFCRREEILLPLILHSHHRVQTISDTCAPCPLIHFCQAPLGGLRDVPFMQKISLTHVTLAVDNTYLVPQYYLVVQVDNITIQQNDGQSLFRGRSIPFVSIWTFSVIFISIFVMHVCSFIHGLVLFLRMETFPGRSRLPILMANPSADERKTIL